MAREATASGIAAMAGGGMFIALTAVLGYGHDARAVSGNLYTGLIGAGAIHVAAGLATFIAGRVVMCRTFTRAKIAVLASGTRWGGAVPGAELGAWDETRARVVWTMLTTRDDRGRGTSDRDVTCAHAASGRVWARGVGPVGRGRPPAWWRPAAGRCPWPHP